MPVSTAVKATNAPTATARKAVRVTKVTSERKFAIELTEEQMNLIADALNESKSKFRVLLDTPKNREKSPDLLSGGKAKQFVAEMGYKKGFAKAKSEFLFRHNLAEALKSLLK